MNISEFYRNGAFTGNAGGNAYDQTRTHLRHAACLQNWWVRRSLEPPVLKSGWA